MLRKFLVLAVLVIAVMLTAVLPAVAQEEFVFGMVLVGPKDDRGWSQAHYEGAVYIEQTVPGARMLLFESLNAVDSPEVTLADVVALFVEEGAKIIFTTSDAFEEDTAAVAPQYPDVVFINVSGDDVLIGTAPANLGNMMAMSEWPRVISGCAAALSSETGKIGYLGPLINAETRRVAASAYLGAQYCWEKYSGSDQPLVFDVVWIGFWFPIPGVTLDATEETNRFFDQGYDIVLSGIDTAEMVTAAARRQEDGAQVYAIPYNNPAGCDQGPEACLGVVYYNWGPEYVKLVEAVQAGSWEQAWEWVTPNFEAPDDLTSTVTGFQTGAGLSEEAAATLAEFVAEVTAYALDEANAESIYLWDGPLSLQDGTELAADGEMVDLLEIWYLPQLLEGMGGASVSE